MAQYTGRSLQPAMFVPMWTYVDLTNIPNVSSQFEGHSVVSQRATPDPPVLGAPGGPSATEGLAIVLETPAGDYSTSWAPTGVGRFVVPSMLAQ